MYRSVKDERLNTGKWRGRTERGARRCYSLPICEFHKNSWQADEIKSWWKIETRKPENKAMERVWWVWKDTEQRCAKSNVEKSEWHHKRRIWVGGVCWISSESEINQRLRDKTSRDGKKSLKRDLQLPLNSEKHWWIKIKDNKGSKTPWTAQIVSL